MDIDMTREAGSVAPIAEYQSAPLDNDTSKTVGNVKGYSPEGSATSAMRAMTDFMLAETDSNSCLEYRSPKWARNATAEQFHSHFASYTVIQ